MKIIYDNFIKSANKKKLFLNIFLNLILINIINMNMKIFKRY